jgi:hypothetical protein
MRLNLGCSDEKLDGWIGVYLVPPADVSANLGGLCDSDIILALSLVSILIVAVGTLAGIVIEELMLTRKRT